MDWRGSTEAKSTRVSAEQSSGEGFDLLLLLSFRRKEQKKSLSFLKKKSPLLGGKNRGQNQFAFSISQLKPLLAFHLIPIKTACLAAAL